MNTHRDSYKKTTVLALGAAAVMGIGAGGLIWTQALSNPELGIPSVLPTWLAWAVGVLLLGGALFSLAVSVGGIMALHYDAKGRATF